jgi:hypothetical protein
MAFLAFHHQLVVAVLAVIPEECWFPALWTVNSKGESARAASYPALLNWGTALRAPGFERTNFPAKRANIRVRRNQLTTILAWFLVA